MRNNEEFVFDGVSMNQYRIIKPFYSHWTVAYALTYNGKPYLFDTHSLWLKFSENFFKTIKKLCFK